MKEDKIREAYDSVTPGYWDVERMRTRLSEALPEEGKTNRSGYRAYAEQTRWWSVLSAAAVCFAVLILGSLVVGKMAPYQQDQHSPTELVGQQETEPTTLATETEAPTEPETTAATEEPDETLPQTPSAPFGPGDYQDYVTRIRQRNHEDSYFGRDTTEYYAYYDLNSDGINDLLISREKGKVWEAITCIDGELRLLFSVGCSFTICTDGSIYTGQEGDTHFVWYRLSGDEQYVTMTVWYDEQVGLWYLYKSQTNQKTAITQSDVEKLLASYEPVDLEMKKLANFVSE